MYSYGNRSKKNLESVHPNLQYLFKQVIKVIDCSIISGFRTIMEQQNLYAQGRTRPGKIVTSLDGVEKKSKHQSKLAVDIAPYPINWEDEKRFIYLAGIVKGIAAELNITIRWGGDWDGNNDMHDQTWMDLPHFELINE